MEKQKKYNLQSSKQDDTQMHAQLGGDMEFVTQLLGAGPSTSSQEECDSQSSHSELNHSDIIHASDLDDGGSHNWSFYLFQTEQLSMHISGTPSNLRPKHHDLVLPWAHH